MPHCLPQQTLPPPVVSCLRCARDLITHPSSGKYKSKATSLMRLNTDASISRISMASAWMNDAGEAGCQMGLWETKKKRKEKQEWAWLKLGVDSVTKSHQEGGWMDGRRAQGRSFVNNETRDEVWSWRRGEQPGLMDVTTGGCGGSSFFFGYKEDYKPLNNNITWTQCKSVVIKKYICEEEEGVGEGESQQESRSKR